MIPLPILSACIVAILVAGCNNAAPQPDPEIPVNGRVLEVTTIAEDLQAPWEVAFAGDRVFVTERDQGRVLELVDGDQSELRSFEVDATGEGGLLGMAPSPDFEDNGQLYVYLTTSADNRVLRFSTDNPGQSEEILTGIPSHSIHNGGRIAFGPDDHLWIATGDAGTPDRSQDPDSLAGKILRVTADGSIPDDNPFADSPVYALGLRNVQGLAWNGDDQLYATEFGPDVDDEINRIEAGENYGWPEVTGESEEEELIDPVFVRQPPVASWSGATFLVESAIPEWDDHLFVAALRGGRLWRIELSDDGQEVVDDDELLVDHYGRLRQVTQAPDGSLWILTNNHDGRGSPTEGDDRILRIGPD